MNVCSTDVSAMVESSDRLSIVSSSSERKMGGSTITKEEEKMLAEEGIYLPADMPLTKVVCACCVFLQVLTSS